VENPDFIGENAALKTVTEVQIWETVYQTISRLEQRWIPPSIPDHSRYFAYDPLPPALFFPGLKAAAEVANGTRFLDVGCGIGTKLAMAHYLGFEVAGIDRHEPYIEMARELVPEAELVVADLEDVKKFDADIIYMYRPGKSERMATRLEKHVVAHAKKGAVVFLPTRNPKWLSAPAAPEVWVV
jgi:SAM-dependent methyltransferase